jgi:hypothetical protein
MVTRKVKYENSLEHFSKINNLTYLLDEFSDRNDLLPSEISCGNPKSVWWNCPKCNSEYDMGTYYRTKIKCNCPFCAGKRVNHTNSLENIFPKVANEWNYDKNESITPKDISHSSGKKVWWICSKGHEWKVSVSHRTVNENGCPYCAGRKTGKDNNLLVTHPELCRDWDYKKNTVHPTTVSWSNKNKFWWKCNNGHEYYKSIHSKVRFPDCPNCNSVLVKRPDLMVEWDYERNEIDPINVSFSSGKKVFWKCLNDSNHIWETSPHKRHNGRGCPFCSESKGEKRIRKWLDEKHVLYESQKQYEGLLGLGDGNLSYDFYILSKKLLIEYQGEYHDGTANNQTKYEYAIQQEHDRRKQEYAKQNNIKLLEIWYWDYKKIEEILEKTLSGRN